MVDAEDGAGGDRGVDVGGAVERVEDDDVVAVVRLLDRDRDVLFLGRDDAGPAADSQNFAEDLVGDDVELLLVLARGVPGAAGEAGHAGDARLLNQAGDLWGDGDGGIGEGSSGWCSVTGFARLLGICEVKWGPIDGTAVRCDIGRAPSCKRWRRRIGPPRAPRRSCAPSPASGATS